MASQQQGKEVSEELKRRIADLYQNTKMSQGAIAHFLDISIDTVQKYKDYWTPQQHL